LVILIFWEKAGFLRKAISKFENPGEKHVLNHKTPVNDKFDSGIVVTESPRMEVSQFSEVIFSPSVLNRYFCISAGLKKTSPTNQKPPTRDTPN